MKTSLHVFLLTMCFICSNSLLAGEKPPRVGLIMKSLANEFFMAMEEGAKEHQKTNGSYELICG